MTGVRVLLLLLAALAVAVQPALADGPEKKPADPTEVSYYRNIRPIFQQHCQGCHQPARAKGGFVMTDHASLLKPGESGEPSIVSGQPDKSSVFMQIIPHGGNRPAMPKGQPALTDYDVNLVKKWIGQGARDDTPASAREVVDAEHPPSYVLPPVITAIDYSPDSKLLAVGGYHEVLLHKADGSGLVGRLVGLSERVQSVAFSPNGKLLAVTAGDPCRFGEIQIWDVAKQRLKLSVPVTYDTIYGASWSPDGSKLAFGCADNTLRAIEAATGKQVLFQGAHSDWVLATTFSTEGDYLVSVSRDRSMKLTEVATQRFIDNITSITPGALKGGLLTVARRPLDYRKMVKSPPDPREHLYNELLVAGSDGVPRLYKMHREVKRVIGDDANKIREFAPMPGRIFSGRFNTEGSRMVIGSSLEGQGEVRIYKVGPDRPDPRYAWLAGLPLGATRGLTSLVAVSGHGGIGQVVCKLQGQHGAIYAVAYRPDGQQVASAGFDGAVRLNDPQTGKLLKEFIPVPLTNATVKAGGNK
jgi:WD40 repeat protein/mono/diheme cytochrome c family protein